MRRGEGRSFFHDTMRYIYFRQSFSPCSGCDLRYICSELTIPPCTADTIMQRATCKQCRLFGTRECPDYGKLVPVRSFPCDSYAGPNDFESV